jgi:hypothetical protein
MENPSQSHYTTEELFMLKPEIIEEIIENSEVYIAPAPDVEIAITHKQPIKSAFWPRYKWYIIGGGIVIIAGVAWYIYNENQNKKKNVQKN